ncbi:MAG: hypothetical protein H7X89_01885 [Rhizobiales bacterium]|nr:hypothetical protein [Hyphomicrobiales bacterium]
MITRRMFVFASGLAALASDLAVKARDVNAAGVTETAAECADKFGGTPEPMDWSNTSEHGDHYQDSDADNSRFNYYCKTPELDEQCLNAEKWSYDVATGKCQELCFLTTACTQVIGLRDNCFELRTLRRFRDVYLVKQPGGLAEITLYYSLAPLIMQRLYGIGARARNRELAKLYARYVLPCAVLAALGFNKITHREYRRMVIHLKRHDH